MDEFCPTCDTPYDDFIEIVTDQENDSIVWECPVCKHCIPDSEFRSV